LGIILADLHQKELLSESNKVLFELDPTTTGNSSSVTSVPELDASFQRIKTDKQELTQQKRDLQLTERDLRNKVIEEIDKRWNAIEYIKSEIITLQKKCNELTSQIVSDPTLKKNNVHQKRTLLASLIVAAGLIFYALGIATDFFALPVFSSFFILSYNTAHAISYEAAVAGIVLIAVILTLNFRKNRKKVSKKSPEKVSLTTIR
jgi:hypothetical protein